jgi:ABC-type polysaccharide/polyol phosphate transport system ATPase subunit
MSLGLLSASEGRPANAVAIDVDHVSKGFRLPHERRTTLKEYFLHPLRRSTYEEQRALQDVSFRVCRGEFFGIVGPNGSGKSTLLKIIAGIYRQDAGTVRVDGLLSPFIELGVGFNPELTARDNIRINGTLLGMSRKELEKRFEDIVAFSELERFIDQKLKNYSSGMQVRLAYAIGIQVDFDILLLDEVLAVGDAAFQEKCFASFERIRSEGRTIVLVTHDLSVVQRFADRAALLLRGQVHALGPPDEVTDTYRELAASFKETGAFAV